MLTALADGPRHGYGIVGEVAELSQRRVKLKIGSLYGVLDRLSADGLIEPDREEAHDGRLDGLVSVFVPDGQRRIVPAPPATIAAPPGGVWPDTVWYAVGYVWILVFVATILGHYRVARVTAVLAIVPALVWLLHEQLAGSLLSPFASWSFWFLIDLAPVLAMTAFHRDAPPAARRPWLLALPVYYLLVFTPVAAAKLTGHFAWVPDTPGLCCVVVALLCLAHVPRAWSSRSGTGVWSLTLVLLAAVAGVYRITSLGDYVQDPT